MLGWAGLRGATPIVFATFPVTAGLEKGPLIFNVAFFVVLVSTVLQGTTIEPVARLLGVTSDEAAIPTPLVEPVLLSRLGAEVVQFPVRRGHAVVGHPVRELGLPREALLNLIVRGERAIPPRGSTIIQAGDQLHLIVRQEVAVEFQSLLARWRTGPLEAHKRPRPRVLSRPAVTTMRPWGSRRRPIAPAGGGRAWPSWTSCGPGATSRGRSSPSPTGASRSPAVCSRWGRPESCRVSPAGGWRGPRRPASGLGGRRWWAPWPADRARVLRDATSASWMR